MAQTTKNETASSGSGTKTKTVEGWWRQSAAAKEKNEERHYIELDKAGVIKNLDGTFLELQQVLDPADKTKHVYEKDGITYYLWITKEGQNLVQRVPTANYKPFNAEGGGGKGKGQAWKIIDEVTIVARKDIFKLEPNAEFEIRSDLVKEYIKQGFEQLSSEWKSVQLVQFDKDLPLELLIVYNLAKKQPAGGAAATTAAEEKKDGKEKAS